METFFEILTQLNIPVAYGLFKEEPDIPYIVYTGGGQNNFPADDTYYHSRNTYQVEYYYKDKDEEKESEIEALLLENGYPYTKSEDIYMSDQDLWLIYYDV